MDNELKKCLISSIYYKDFNFVKDTGDSLLFPEKVMPKVMIMGKYEMRVFIRYCMNPSKIKNIKLTYNNHELLHFGSWCGALLLYDERLDPDDNRIYYKE